MSVWTPTRATTNRAEAKAVTSAVTRAVTGAGTSTGTSAVTIAVTHYALTHACGGRFLPGGCIRPQRVA